MRITIVGYGVVGKATVAFLKGKKAVFDIDSSKLKGLKNPTWDPLTEADVYFICTLEDHVKDAINEIPLDRLIVIRSSTIPGTIERLMHEMDRHICHFPCFARENNAIWEEQHPSRIIIGECCPFHGQLLEELILKSLGTKPKVIRTTPSTSEVVKLTTNAFLATHITFWNEIYDFCSKSGIDIKKVAQAVTLDKRVGSYGTSKFNEPFGGKCLPKDLKHLTQISGSEFLEMLEKLNAERRGKCKS